MAERLDNLEVVALELIELVYDPKDKTAAGRQEKRTQAKTKLQAVLSAIVAQAHACEAYCAIFAEEPPRDEEVASPVGPASAGAGEVAAAV